MYIAQDLKPFLTDVAQFYSQSKTAFESYVSGLPKSILAFLETENFQEKITEIRNNTSNVAAFSKRANLTGEYVAKTTLIFH